MTAFSSVSPPNLHLVFPSLVLSLHSLVGSPYWSSIQWRDNSFVSICFSFNCADVHVKNWVLFTFFHFWNAFSYVLCLNQGALEKIIQKTFLKCFLQWELESLFLTTSLTKNNKGINRRTHLVLKDFSHICDIFELSSCHWKQVSCTSTKMFRWNHWMAIMGSAFFFFFFDNNIRL